MSAAIVWVATVVAHTERQGHLAPTDRSMPPPLMTNVMPTLTTPMTEASRRMVSALSTLANRSPAVITPDDAEQQQGDDQAEVAPDRARHEDAQREPSARPRPEPAARPRRRPTGSSAEADEAPSGSGDFWVDSHSCRASSP